MQRISLLFLSILLSGYTSLWSSELTWTQQSIQQAETLYASVLETLHKIQGYQAYWTQQLNPSWRAYINRSPRHWTSKEPYTVKVKHKLESLKNIADWYATGLGMLDTTLKKIQSSTKLADQIECFKQLAIIVNHFSSHNLDILEPPHLQESHGEQSIKQILIANEYHLRQYHKLEESHISAYKIPSHFTRNWLSYSFIAATLAGVLYYEHKHPGSFNTAYQYVCDGFQKYIKEPIANSMNTLFGPSTQVETKDKLATKQKSRYETIKYTLEEDYRNDNASYGGLRAYTGDIPQHEKQKIEDIAFNAVFKGQEEELEKRRLEQIKRPIKNLIMNNLTRHFYIQIQGIDCDAYKSLLEAQNIMESNRFTQFLLSMIPVGFFAYAVYYSYEKVNKYYRNKNIYFPLRHAICMLHHILNMPTHTATTHGHFVYWLSQLKEYSKYFGAAEYQLLMIDITHLESAQLSTAQKLNIIQRMFYTYGFLKAAPVLLETRHVTDLLSVPIEVPMLA